MMNCMRPFSFTSCQSGVVLCCIIHGIRPRYPQVNYYPVVLDGSLCISWYEVRVLLYTLLLEHTIYYNGVVLFDNCFS